MSDMSDKVEVIPVSSSFLGSAGIELEHYERLFNTANSLIAIVTFDGYLEHLNPAWSDLLGYSNEELCSQPLGDFIHPENVEETLGEIERLSTVDCTVVDFKNRCRCKDGSYRWFSGTRRPTTRTIASIASSSTSQHGCRPKKSCSGPKKPPNGRNARSNRAIQSLNRPSRGQIRWR